MEKPAFFQLMVDPGPALAAARRLASSLPVHKQLFKRDAAEGDFEASEKASQGLHKRIVWR